MIVEIGESPAPPTRQKHAPSRTSGHGSNDNGPPILNEQTKLCPEDRSAVNQLSIGINGEYNFGASLQSWVLPGVDQLPGQNAQWQTIVVGKESDVKLHQRVDYIVEIVEMWKYSWDDE